MKHFYIVFLFVYTFTHAQDQHDYNWLLGYGPGNPGLFFGGSHLNFNVGQVEIGYLPLPSNVRLELPCSVSDKDGALQFYTSGCTIRNMDHEVMENGNNINAGEFHDYCCGITTGDGYLNHNGMTAIPVPGQEGQYYLFHIRIHDTHSDDNELLYTLIDMNENNGKGKVVLKDQALQWIDTLALTVNAIRHGNGRDWWIVTENVNKSEFYLYLVDIQGIHPPVTYSLPDGWIAGHFIAVQLHVSNSGHKIAQMSGDSPAAFTLFDFDRCTGEISNPLRIDVPEDTIMYPTWMCFSPSDRYLYVTNTAAKLYQFDLHAADIAASRQLVGEYDGFLSVYNLPSGFYHMTLGPDMKIYMGCSNAVNVLHTIESPELDGSLCDFRQHSLALPGHAMFHLPNFPNFRLYQQLGSPCDTLGVVPPLVAQWRTEQDSVPGQYTVAFTEYSYHAPVEWVWDFGDGAALSTARHPVHTFPDKGQYNVCLTACNAGGVCDTLCRVLEVKEKISGTGLWPGGTGPGYVLNVYPNPVTDYLWVRHGAGAGIFRLFDQTGRLVQEQRLATVAETESVDLSRLPSGLYVWQVRAANGQVTAGKVMKE